MTIKKTSMEENGAVSWLMKLAWIETAIPSLAGNELAASRKIVERVARSTIRDAVIPGSSQPLSPASQPSTVTQLPTDDASLGTKEQLETIQRGPLSVS
jgi:hypothetical protein